MAMELALTSRTPLTGKEMLLLIKIRMPLMFMLKFVNVLLLRFCDRVLLVLEIKVLAMAEETM